MVSQAQQTAMTPDEFLAWEAGQDVRWEFDGTRPVAMNGVSVAHSRILSRLALALGSRLRGTPCETHMSSLKVGIGPKYRYPDLFVSCSQDLGSLHVVTEPVVIFEILSGSTARTDRTLKLVEYRSIPALQRYVMLEQDQPLATVIGRTATGWSLEVLGRDGTLAMPEIGVEVPMAELYEGMEFEPLPDVEEPR